MRKPRIDPRLPPTFACAALMLIGAPAGAQCFCLAHPVTEQVAHYGCTAKPIPNRISERVTCLNELRTGRAAISDSASFTRIREGEGVCNPCAPLPSEVLPEIPRQPNQITPPSSEGAEPNG